MFTLLRIKPPNKDDLNVVDLKMKFRGREEAFVFMRKWLGSYAIIDAEWMATYFRNRIEECLDNLEV